MTPFDFISVALSIVLGLGITQLLVSVVRIFKGRVGATLDWIPFVWAGTVFVAQIQFWWAIYELSTMHAEWRLAFFLCLLWMTLLLFLAASLVLPGDEFDRSKDLVAEFRANGKWALTGMAAYHLSGMLMNWYFWGAVPWQNDFLLLGSLVLLPFVYLATTRRAVQVGATVLEAVILLYLAYIHSPQAY